MSLIRAWTLVFSTEYVQIRETGTARLSLDPTDPDPPTHWWSGEGTLHFEGHDWSGAQTADGMLMEFGAVESTPNLEETAVTGRLALTDESLRRALALDLGPLHVEVGWIRSTDYGKTWNRTNRYYRGQARQGVDLRGGDGGQYRVLS